MQQTSYLMIAKEHYTTGEINYRVHIEFPNISVFNEMNAVELEAIESYVFNKIIQEKNTYQNQNESNSQIEKVGIEAFMDIVQNGLSTDAFIESGWAEQLLEEGDYGKLTASTSNNNFDESGVWDFSGITFKSEGQEYLIRNILQQSFNQLPTNIGIVMSDSNNSVSEMDEAKDIVEIILDTKVILWMHFDLGSDGTPLRMFYKATNNLSSEEAEQLMSNAINDEFSLKNQDEDELRTTNCNPSWTWAKDCFYENLTGEYSFEIAMGLGFMDGILGFFSGINKVSESFLNTTDSYLSWIAGPNYDFVKYLNKVAWGQITIKQAYESIKNEQIHKIQVAHNSRTTILKNYLLFKLYWDDVLETAAILFLTFTPDDILAMIGVVGKQIYCQIENFFGNHINDIDKALGYLLGTILFEVVFEITLAVLTAGSTLALILPKLISYGGKFVKLGGGMVDDIFKAFSKVKNKPLRGKCGVLWGGCFVKDTPVLVANKNYNLNFPNTKSLAVAAAIPIIAVPIQEVQLLDYAVAHETVNSTDGLTASVDDEIYLGLMKDPYTSDQQRQRDEFEINDTDWSEVVFEEVLGGSIAKLALHEYWINRKGYEVNDIVEMNLPEQGINGPFRISSIKHIIPQKKPVDDDEWDDYGYKPVTALFIHQSNQVFNIDFENGESLGVTYQHPIFSTSEGDWRLAGELQIGERVLTKYGETTIIKSEKKKGQETVYNLEIKDLHNFLVSVSGIVVHNNYFPDAKQLAKVLGISKNQIHDVKKLMIKDWKNDFPFGFGNNPDIGYSDLGELIFKSRINGTEFNTGFDIFNYVD